MLTPAPARAKLEDVVLCDRSRHSEAPGAVRAVETEQNRGCQGPGARDWGPGRGVTVQWVQCQLCWRRGW